jgi:phospholipase C
VSSKSIPNRIATFTGGTTQGLVFDPGADDKLPQLKINTIFNELDQAKVSWKVYYTVTNGGCTAGTACGSGAANYPDTTFSILQDSFKYFYVPTNGAACSAPTQPSSVVGDPSNSFCIDPTRIAPLSTYFTDLQNQTLPSFAFIESGSGVNDEHPGSGQSVLAGQAQVANVINSLMSSTSWQDSVFFLAYDEGGGPYDHVPPVPGHSNDNTTASLLSSTTIPDIGGIAVNPESNYFPCVPTQTPGAPTVPATTHCDLRAGNPGVDPGDAPAQQGFAAQLGFRVPNIIISPFVRKHYVGNNPMDHTAILKFVENRFIGPSAHLTARDAAQPDLTDFFDFTGVPWATPPTGIPTPAAIGSSCHAGTLK